MFRIGIGTSLGAVVVSAALVGAPDARAEAPGSRLVVHYAPAADPLEVEDRVGASLVARIPRLGVRVLEVDTARVHEVLALLRRDSSVRSAEPERTLEAAGRIPNDPFWPTQWSPLRTNAPAAWSVTTGSASVVVAVVDSGVDSMHPDLQGKVLPGHDFVNGDADPDDDNGHGTAVAGIVGALSDNGSGVAAYCWRCSILPVKVLGADGRGTDVDTAAGIVWATDRGARVINLSLGGPESSTLAQAVDYARSRGALVVAAAGNEGSTVQSYPAAIPGVVSVAATDENDRLYSWSNFGPWVALAAPGVNSTTGLGDRYVSFAGTSSATPVVSGIAALAFALAPASTAADVTAALQASAASVDGVTAGRVDASATLKALSPPPASALAPAPAAPAPAPALAPAPAVPVPNGEPVAAPPAAERRPVSTTRLVGRVARKSPRTLVLRIREARVRTRFAVSAPARVTVGVVAGNGRVVRRAAGRSNVRLSAVLRSGRYRVVVRTASERGIPFRLSVVRAAA